MNILKYFKKDFTAKKYCDLFYTFPDGTKLYKIKDSYIEKLPAKKLLSIQENSNYIAFLGISKSMLEASQNKCERLSVECEILTERKAKHTEILAKQKELTSTIQAQKISKSEYDNAISTVMLSIFEMFFYFEKEPLFVNDEFWTEKKREYLNKYPSLRVFFFKSLESYTSDLKITWDNAINLAVAQTTIQELIKQLAYTTTEDEKMD
jgi:hypothetical protein